MHPHRQLHPGPGSQRDLPVDPGGLASSVQLRRLAHADQRVAPAAQHEFLQVPDRGQGTIPRRLEDPLPQAPYVLLVQTPVNAVPVEGRVLRSVHHRCLTCPSVPTLPVACLQRLTCPCQRPFQGPGTKPGIRPVIQERRPGGAALTSWFPVDFRPPAPCFRPAPGVPSPAPPAFAFWASCSRQGIPRSLRSAYQTAPRRPGPCRGSRVPHV